MSEQRGSNEVNLTVRQSLMWLEGLMHPEAPINNMTTRLDIQQSLDVDAFNTAFSKMAAKYDAMRLVVSRRDQKFVGIVTTQSVLELSFIDLSDSPCAETQLQEWIQNVSSHVFQLDQPLYQAYLIKVSDQHYTFFMNQHHCVTDGRSCQLMLNSLDAFYREQIAIAAIAPSIPLSPTPSFSDYLVQQADYMQSDGAKLSEEFWAQKFAVEPEAVKFFGNGTQLKTLSTERHSCSLPATLAKKILAAKKTTSPSLVFAAVLFAFLRRSTGNSDICIAVPLLNRQPDYADTIGLFMEVSRNRLMLNPKDSFESLLLMLRDEASLIKPHRAHTVVSRNARYEAMLNYRVPADTLFAGESAQLKRVSPLTLLTALPGDALPSAEWSGRDSLEVDITHTPASGEFYLAMDFNRGVWPDFEQRERALAQFLRLLEHFFDSHMQSIDQLELLSDPEKILIGEWSSVRRGFPDTVGVHQLFEAQVNKTPMAVALEFGAEAVSFDELNKRANCLAHSLARHGVGPGSLVGVCLYRSVNLVVALLASLKAGAAYVPIDPTHPQLRRDMVLEEVSPTVLLTEQSLQALTQQEGAARDGDDLNPALPCSQGDLAYVIFTSGSTGRPKGVMIEHGALANSIHAARSELNLVGSDRFFSVSTAAFDIFALELFLPLTVGACMVLANEETVSDGCLLAEAIRHTGATHMQATPATWHLLLQAQWQPARPLTALVGAELLTTELAGNLAPLCASLTNWYGPTETTIWATKTAVTEDYRAGIVGRPLAGYSVHILDPRGKHVPIGSVGEITIGGKSLARGYMNRDDLTAKAFVNIEHLGRVYRTGDLGRWTIDGNIEFLGRMDSQVKVRGYRIELGEVEAALNSCPGVSASVVTVFGSAENKQLAAYVRLGEPLGTSELREHLKSQIPGYMIPATFTVLEFLPLTPSGKVDRSALPAPHLSQSASVQNYVSPHTPIQQVLADIWEEVLELKTIGIEDDFFDLGGHSLLVIRIQNRIREELGFELGVNVFFDAPTIALLEQVILVEGISDLDEQALIDLLAEVEKS